MSKANYEILETLGTGSFGTVCKLRRKADNKIMVWKDINFGKMSEKEKSQLVAEVNILRDLRNPFIVRYMDRIVDKPTTRLYIIMEYCAGGDLGRIISRCKRDRTTVDEAFIWKIFAQATVALKDCHRRCENGEAKPIIHRDLKPANILLDSNQNIKLGDFGLAKELSSKSKLATTSVGTPYYMAPEILNEKDYDERSDIWSLGCLLYELAALRPPFDASNAVSLAMKINAGKYARIPSKYSDALFDCIKMMLQTDPKRRPRVEDLETVPALQGPLAQARLIVMEFNAQAQQSKVNDITRREEAVKLREDAVAQAEAALVEREKALQKWMEQLQAQQNELHQQQQAVLLQKQTQAVPPPPAMAPPRSQSVENRRMSVEPMACDDEDTTCIPVTTATSVASMHPPPPPAQHSAPLQPTFTFGAVPPKPVPPSNGFTIFADKLAMEAPAAIKHAKDILSGKSAVPTNHLRPAPSIPSYARVNSAPAGPGIAPSNLGFNNHRAGAHKIITGSEDAQENQQQHDNFLRKPHSKCAWEGQENEHGHNNNKMIAEGMLSPWKKQRQFAGPVPVPTNAAAAAQKVPTTHFVNLQALLAEDNRRK